MDNWLVTLIVVIALVVGVFGGAWGFSDTETITKEVEVIKEVAVPAVCEEEAVECTWTDTLDLDFEVSDGLLEMALGDFLIAVEDEEDEDGNTLELLECGVLNDRHEFDFDELSVSRVDNEWSVAYDRDRTTVDFEVRMKYKETDEKSCRQTFEVKVVYEDGEDTKVSVTE